MEKTYRLGVIGGGFMAKAILHGAWKSEFLSPSDVAVGEPDDARALEFTHWGAFTCADNRYIAENCDYLLFAVKPQVFPQVAEELKGCRLPVVLSIMAGKTRSAISSALGGGVKVARAMPNLPCSVGKGAIAIDTSALSERESAFAHALFASTGAVVETEERLLNAVTGVSGSGPAYVYLFLQALTSAGEEQGLSAEQAKMLALRTLTGGAEMVMANPERSLQELIDAVSSKGGTTVAALESFARDDFKGAVSRAVGAAVRRAAELSV